ncbi:hypothetical protein ERY430_40541 [Erythrobacter sp. EC-HK427]|nr:hypothetical protein ERY430_40541 [Erythrobacter sp. EC-HK427]
MLRRPWLVLYTHDESRRFDYEINLSTISGHHFSSDRDRFDDINSRKVEPAEQRVQKEYVLTMRSPRIENVSYDPTETGLVRSEQRKCIETGRPEKLGSCPFCRQYRILM